MIYKQLWDFRSGARTNAVMSPFAVNLTDQEIFDLVDLPAVPARLPGVSPSAATAEAAHRDLRHPDARDCALRLLSRQPRQQDRSRPARRRSEAYMKAQLQTFAASQRTNDISQQMRIARTMTQQEIDQAAAYYASQPPDVVKATD